MNYANRFEELDSGTTNEIGSLLPEKNLEANHHDLFRFKTAEKFSLPLSLIHVTHKCSLDEHKTWLCLLSNAYEIMNHLKSDPNFNQSSYSSLNFRIPLEVLRFKTDSNKRIKYVIQNLSNLKKARIQIDLLNRDGLRSLTSQFNFINDFTIKIEGGDLKSGTDYESNSIKDDNDHIGIGSNLEQCVLGEYDEDQSRSRIDYSTVSIVYNLPMFFNSIFLESNIEDLTHLFSWTNINSVSAKNNKKGSRIENLLYCLMESSSNEIELDFNVFKAYLGFIDNDSEDRYIIRDSIKPAISSFNENELMNYTIEFDLIRGKWRKISSIVLKKKMKSFTNEEESKIWRKIMGFEFDNIHRRVMLKQLMPKENFDDLTNVDLDTITRAVDRWMNNIKSKGDQNKRPLNYIGACKAGFAKRYGFEKAIDSSSATIVGNESVVRAAKVGLENSVGKNDDLISPQIINNPLSKLSATLHLIIGRCLIKRNTDDALGSMDMVLLKKYVSVAHKNYQNNLQKVTGICGLLGVTFPDFKVSGYDLDNPSLALSGYLLPTEATPIIYGKLASNANYIACETHSKDADIMMLIYSELLNFLESNYSPD